MRNMQSLGIEIESVTSDGGANIIKAVSKACPDRCNKVVLPGAHPARVPPVVDQVSEERGGKITQSDCYANLQDTDTQRHALLETNAQRIARLIRRLLQRQDLQRKLRQMVHLLQGKGKQGQTVHILTTEWMTLVFLRHQR